jgi:NADH-quinone oxidoreductase subunit G
VRWKRAWAAERFNLVREGWNGFNVLHMAASRMGGLMLGYAQPGGLADLVAAKPKMVISLGADEVDWTKFADSMIVHIGHHGDKAAHAADVILPAAAFSEKDGTYVNTEGRVQFAERAVFAPGEAREDWTILRALADAFGVNVGFDSFEQLRAAMIAQVPRLARKVWPITARCLRPGHGGLRGHDRLSDQGSVSHQRHRPRQPDAAALLGGTAPR